MKALLASLTLLMPLALAADEKISWFGTWERAQAAAKATKRPILFISAAPHCKNISGIW